jgi:hypothetical protein
MDSFVISNYLLKSNININVMKGNKLFDFTSTLFIKLLQFSQIAVRYERYDII